MGPDFTIAPSCGARPCEGIEAKFVDRELSVLVVFEHNEVKLEKISKHRRKAMMKQAMTLLNLACEL